MLKKAGMNCGCRSIHMDQISGTSTNYVVWTDSYKKPAWVEGQLEPGPAQSFQSGTSTRMTAFGRGPTEGVIKNASGTCWDVRTLCKAGQLKKALHLLNHGDILADSNAYIYLLQECIRRKGLAEGKQVHAHIIQIGFKPNIILHNTFIKMYAECGSIVDADLVFDKMPERDMYSWNIMMTGYAKHGCAREVLKIYEQMIRDKVTPNQITFTCVLKVCTSLGSLEKGKKVHADIVKAGFVPDIILGTALVAMYAKCGSIKDAHQVFDNMAQRDVISWNAMITGYAQHGCGREALKIYEQMISEKVTPNRVTFVCTLKACTSLAALEKGKEVHGDIMKAGIVPDIILETTLVDMYAKCGDLQDACRVFHNMTERDVFSWSVMISGYAQHGHGKEALDAYEQMIREGVIPDQVMFVCILNACASLAALEKGKEVHADVVKAGIVPGIILDTALVDMYAKCGSIKDANEVFKKMARRDVVSWSAMIAGYVQHGCGRDALESYLQMNQEGVMPNMVTFVSVLNACASLAALEKGKEVHADILKAGVEPNIILDTALVDMYAKCGSLMDANRVFGNMVYRDVVSWNAMIAGYAQHGRGREALDLFEKCKRKG